MYETLEWNVPLAWSYDPAEIAKGARELMEEDNCSYDDALTEVVMDAVCGEDDYLYYNFGDDECKAVVKRIKELYPYNEQLTLF